MTINNRSIIDRASKCLRLSFFALSLLWGISVVQASTQAPLSDSQEAFVADFVENYYNIYGIDTSGDEPVISVTIETNGNFKQLDSAGISTAARYGNTIMTRIPIRMISQVNSLPSVVHLIFSMVGRIPEDDSGDKFLNIRGRFGKIRGEIACHAQSDINSPKIKCFSDIQIRKFTKAFVDGVRSSRKYDSTFQPIDLRADSSCRFWVDLAPGFYEAQIDAIEYTPARKVGKYFVADIPDYGGKAIVIFIRVAPDSISYVPVHLFPTDNMLDPPIQKWEGEIYPIFKK